MTAADRAVPVLAVGVGVATWWAVADRVGPLLLPTPWEVGAAAISEFERLGTATWHTLVATACGLLVASTLGLAAAVAAWWRRPLALALLPYTVAVQIVPIVAVAPLLVVWLGYGTAVASVTAAIAAFYPVYAAASTGLRAPSADLVDLFALYRASRWAELWRLRLPAALPTLLSGLRSAAGLAVIGAIVGEFVGSNGFPPTLGYLVVFSARSANLGLCFAAVLAAGVLALSLHALLAALDRATVARWYG